MPVFIRQLPFTLPNPNWTRNVQGSIGETETSHTNSGVGVRDAWVEAVAAETESHQIDGMIGRRVSIGCIADTSSASVLIVSSVVRPTVVATTSTEQHVLVSTVIHAG